MPRFNSSTSVPLNNGVTPRRGGRVSGQPVSRYRSYVPPAGDRIVEAQIIVSPKRAWDHLLSVNAAFDRTNILEDLRTIVLVVLTSMKMVILWVILEENHAFVLIIRCSTIVNA
ncbi:hypothetical protein G6F20_011713 [Rhizopus arrhizus]|nr:hypothetical protein G6F20_011713 [Rhizopus arrhizus]